jgi:hypothetical protein
MDEQNKPVGRFPAPRWVDLARGLVVGDEKAAMRQALQTGPPGRARMVRVFEALAEYGREEAAVVVPDPLVRRAMDLFACPLPDGLVRQPLIAARLITTPRELAGAGARSSNHGTQALYEAGRFWVDLRVSHEFSSQRTMLVGQIADRSDPRRRVPDLMVMLMAGKDVVRRDISNELGEFELECDPAKHQHLLIPVPGGGRLELPVPKLTPNT